MANDSFVHYLKQIFKEVSGGHISSLLFLSYYKRWKQFLGAGRTAINDEQPWITFPAIDILEKVTDKDAKVFEYGGGGSTLFFVKRAGEVVTVEHDAVWFNVLQSLINEKKLNNWKGNLVPGELKDKD